MNKIVRFIEETKPNFCGCGLCFGTMQKNLEELYLLDLEPLNIDSRAVPLNYPVGFLESLEPIFTDLNEISYDESDNLSNARKDFFSKEALVLRYLIIYIDELLRNRDLLKSILGDSLAKDYLEKMENHSKDYGTKYNI
tara:strand:- start:2801 stop:3217 length:417 start_codon:yes stop_codon:yes gene_type:complete